MPPKYCRFKIVSTIACNKVAESVHQDQTSCSVQSDLVLYRLQNQVNLVPALQGLKWYQIPTMFSKGFFFRVVIKMGLCGKELTHSHTKTPFDASGKEAF